MPETVSTDAKQSKPWLFKPGQSGNPAGRPKSSRNKLGEDFVDALAADFAEHGTAAISTVRDKHPDQYLKVIAAVVPKEVHHRVEDYDDLSEAEIETRLTALLASAGSAGGSRKAGRGASTAAGTEGIAAQLPN